MHCYFLFCFIFIDLKIFLNNFKDYFKSLYWICYNIVCYVLFGLEACGTLALWPGIKLVSAALEGKVLTTEQLGKSLVYFLNAGQHTFLQYDCLENPMGGGAW